MAIVAVKYVFLIAVVTPNSGVVVGRGPRRPILRQLGSSARVFGADTPTRNSLNLALRNSAQGVVDVRRGPITSLHVSSQRCSPI